MTHKIYILLILLLFAISCSKSATDEPSPGPDTPESPVGPEAEPDLSVSFSPCDVTQASSRAALESTHQHIRVFAYKNTASDPEKVMPGYHVLYFGSENWQYDASKYPDNTTLAGQFLKYWDESAVNYQFYGYAPVNDANKDMTALDFGTLQAHVNVGDATDYDYLVSQHDRTLSPLADTDMMTDQKFAAPDPVPTHVYDIVPLRFHHIFSEVEFRLCNTGSYNAILTQAMVKIEDAANVHFFVSGNYAAPAGWTCTFENWSADGCLLNKSYDPVEEIEPLGTNPKETHSYLLAQTIEVPQNMKSKRVVITIEIDGTPISKVFELPDNWGIDKKYIYYITFETSDQKPIFVDVIANDFLRGDIINNTQTNW